MPTQVTTCAVVLVLVGMLLMYRDWRVLLFAAGLFAVHHVLFDRLQAMALGAYCTPAPDFLRIVLHAVYVVIQTGVEIFLAVRLRHAAVEAAELLAIVGRIDQGSEQIVGGTHTLGEHAEELRRTVAVMEEITQSVAEAARAGDAGRGFAVVATEVRQLAQRAGSAAKDIRGLITDSTDRVRESMRLVGAAQGEIDRLAEQSQRVSVLIDEISAVAGRHAEIVSRVWARSWATWTG